MGEVASNELTGLRDALAGEIAQLDEAVEGPERERERRRAELQRLREQHLAVTRRIEEGQRQKDLEEAKTAATLAAGRYQTRAIRLVHDVLSVMTKHERLSQFWHEAMEAVREVERLGGQMPHPIPEYPTGSQTPTAAAAATIEKVFKGVTGDSIGWGQWGPLAGRVARKRKEQEADKLRREIEKGRLGDDDTRL